MWTLIVWVTCNADCDIDMGDLVYEPPRDGPTLWEIGIPDRSAAEFYVPDPNPKYINKLYVNHPDRLNNFLFHFFPYELVKKFNTYSVPVNNLVLLNSPLMNNQPFEMIRPYFQYIYIYIYYSYIT